MVDRQFVQRSFSHFIGIDLGGGRGKTTAVAFARGEGHRLLIEEIATRSADGAWTDDSLWNRLAEAVPGTAIAINAPLTQPACTRCPRPVCPGTAACDDPAVVWLRGTGQDLVDSANLPGRAPTPRARLAPYNHRATEVWLSYGAQLTAPSALGGPSAPIAARAHQLRRRLAGVGFELHRNLLEVAPAATINARFGPRRARGYKRDADPWVTRAAILTELDDVVFAPRSRMARETALGNEHCFDALVCAVTAFWWARDHWPEPSDSIPWRDDGWIWAPEPARNG